MLNENYILKFINLLILSKNRLPLTYEWVVIPTILSITIIINPKLNIIIIL